MTTVVTRALVRRLPVQPIVAAAVLERLEAADGPGDAGNLEAWIALDPALAAAVLHAANQPHLNHSGRVATIRQAMVVLGSRMVEAIATGRVATLVMTPTDPGAPSGFWPRSIAAAVGSRVVARAIGVTPEVAYTAGLLHELGDLALFREDPDRHRAVTEGASARNLLERERRSFGRPHTEAGAVLLRDWLLPDQLIRAVRIHHAPHEQVSGALNRAVWAGVRLGYSVARQGLPEPWSTAAVLQLMGIDESADRLITEIAHGIEAVVAAVEARR
jgi:putative nucleotidyltransferase with HDIG domain